MAAGAFPEVTADVKISIIVPVYNEAATVGEVVRRLAELPMELEIVLVDDGSRDGTGAVLEELARAVPAIAAVVRLPQNRGKGAAVRLGLARAAGAVVVIQDADLELDPEQILELVAPIAAGRAEVVYGSRFLAGERSGDRLQRWANGFLTGLTNVLFGLGLTDMETCYKAFRSEWIPRLRLTGERFEIEPEITAEFARLGLAIHEVPVRYRPRTRAAGKKIRWWDGVLAVTMLVRKWAAGCGAGARSRGGRSS